MDPFGLCAQEYRSPEWLRALVPGQVAFDNGVTCLQAGRYVDAGLFFGQMLGEQLLAVATLGEGSALLQGAEAVSATAPPLSSAAEGGTVESMLMPGGNAIGNAGSRAAIREVPGGLSDAKSLFDQLSAGGEAVSGSTYPGPLVRLPNGGTVGIRTTMSNSPGTVATIDVNIPGVPMTKTKFNP